MTAWEYDDGGRALAGFRGDARDCVVRAIAIAAELPYDLVYADLADRTFERPVRDGTRNARTARNGIAKNVRRAFLSDLGWHWTPTMQIGSGTTVHLRADELPRGRLIVSVSRHLVAVVDGVIRDTFDCSRDGTRCVYGFYSPPTREGAAAVEDWMRR